MSSSLKPDPLFERLRNRAATTMNQGFAVSLSTIVFLGLLGCGGDGLDRVPLMGTVTMDGAPLTGAVLSFTPAAGTPGEGALGVSDEAGKFEVISSREGDTGIPAGEYTVRVSRRVLPDGSPLPPDVPEADFPQSRESIPPPYSTIQSPLKVVIPEGGGEITVEVPAKPEKKK